MINKSTRWRCVAAALLLLPLSILISDVEAENPPTRNSVSGTSISERFADRDAGQPDFQRHVAPLLGRLGCNGRACHGSFQGQGGFRLSLFGYDFKADHESMMDGRIDLDDPANSLILTKPTDEDNHEGGLRYEVDSWQYNLICAWIESGAKSSSKPHQLSKLIVEPSELLISESTDNVQLKVTAVWEDETIEDVTELCRFDSNNPAIAEVTEAGSISSDLAGDTHVVVSYDSAVVAIPVIHPLEKKSQSKIASALRIDQLVTEKLNKLGVEPSQLSDDAMFLRRICLDVTGTLPTPDEIRQFLADSRPDKRARKIDELLESPAYAAWWTTFFCDMTENNSRQLRNITYNNSAVSQHWYSWIHKRVSENTPYDEMIAGIVMGASRRDGESYLDYSERMSGYFHSTNGDQSFAENETMPYYWMRREFQDRDTRAISFAHAFLGLRIQCAQCHKHPFDQWSQEDFQEFAKFFSGLTFRNNYVSNKQDKADQEKILEGLGIDPKEKNRGNIRRKMATFLKEGKTVPFSMLQVHDPKPTKEETTAFRKKKQKPKGPQQAKLLGSEPIDLTQYDDIREPVLNWMLSSENPYFAKAIVNRIWARYFGVGIVDPADDLNLANPPSNGPLLNYLAQEFVKQGYDLKWLHREIANSHTYQLSWVTNETNQTDRNNFSRALPRRLPAEVIFDAVTSAASNSKTNRGFRDTTESRAISIPGTDFNYSQKKKSSVNSAFALTVFGRSNRSSSCDCDRSEETSLIQTVYLKNDRDIHMMLTQKGSWLNQLIADRKADELTEKERNAVKISEARIVKLRETIQQLKRSGQSSKIVKLDKQIEKLNQRIKPLKDRQKELSQQKKHDNWDLREFVEEAYLRTLSRFPTDDELARCLQYLEGESDLFEGMTGVMWALVNTKEFIVNH